MLLGLSILLVHLVSSGVQELEQMFFDQELEPVLALVLGNWRGVLFRDLVDVKPLIGRSWVGYKGS